MANVHEIEINGQPYELNFGMGFLEDIQKQQAFSSNGAKMDAGLRVAVIGIHNGDVLQLWNVINTANRDSKVRITKQAFEQHLDNASVEDIDSLFLQVEGFLTQSSSTGRTTRQVLMEFGE
jgi:hypothetical protein